MLRHVSLRDKPSQAQVRVRCVEKTAVNFVTEDVCEAK